MTKARIGAIASRIVGGAFEAGLVEALSELELPDTATDEDGRNGGCDRAQGKLDASFPGPPVRVVSLFAPFPSVFSSPGRHDCCRCR